MITIKGNLSKFNQDLIDAIEYKLGSTFPKEYINFLRKYNGGIPENNVVTSEEAPAFILTSFYGTDLEPIYDIYSQYKTFEGRVPYGCVPIASDAGGNLVVLNLSNNKYGYIFFWDHEEELMYEDTGMNLDNLCLIATSFNEFLKVIRPDNVEESDDALNHYEVKEVWVDPEFLKELKDNE